ncbi:uncharacterized protein AB675_4949, partial [Cyphellophora attinorum]
MSVRRPSVTFDTSSSRKRSHDQITRSSSSPESGGPVSKRRRVVTTSPPPNLVRYSPYTPTHPYSHARGSLDLRRPAMSSGSANAIDLTADDDENDLDWQPNPFGYDVAYGSSGEDDHDFLQDMPSPPREYLSPASLPPDRSRRPPTMPPSRYDVDVIDLLSEDEQEDDNTQHNSHPARQPTSLRRNLRPSPPPALRRISSSSSEIVFLSERSITPLPGAATAAPSRLPPR